MSWVQLPVVLTGLAATVPSGPSLSLCRPESAWAREASDPLGDEVCGEKGLPFQAFLPCRPWKRVPPLGCKLNYCPNGGIICKLWEGNYFLWGSLAAFTEEWGWIVKDKQGAHRSKAGENFLNGGASGTKTRLQGGRHLPVCEKCWFHRAGRHRDPIMRL